VKPRLKKIVLTDWPALFCLIAVTGIWGIGLIFPLLRQDAAFGAFELSTVALPVSVVAASFLFWRIVRIRSLFRQGAVATGHITRIQLARDRARVEFIYEFKGVRLESWMPVHQSLEVLSLRESQEVGLLVDESQPRRAIIWHLFA
jgi:hypothetical protein